MNPLEQFQFKTLSIMIIMVLSGSIKKFGCWDTSLSDVTYEDIIDLDATCSGLDSCELPRDPDSIGHCSCNRFCSLLGTCCIDSRYRNTYPKPLKNIECFHNHGRQMLHSIPMINSCDPEVEIEEDAKKLCNSTGEESSDPFLKIPVTDPITGISYKNYYCFACNKNYGAEEPLPWTIEITNKFKESSSSSISKGTEEIDDPNSLLNLTYDNTRRTNVLIDYSLSSLPSLSYDIARETWVMNPNQKNATDVKIDTSLPEQLRNITPVCYDMLFPVISECASDWTYEDVKQNCKAYMAVISIKRRDDFIPDYYYNPHCAICNYKDLEDMSCSVEEKSIYHIFWENEVLLLRLFSLQDKLTTTCEDFMKYDHFSKKCRRVYKAKKQS